MSTELTKLPLSTGTHRLHRVSLDMLYKRSNKALYHACQGLSSSSSCRRSYLLVFRVLQDRLQIVTGAAKNVGCENHGNIVDRHACHRLVIGVRNQLKKVDKVEKNVAIILRYLFQDCQRSFHVLCISNAVIVEFLRNKRFREIAKPTQV